MTNRDLLMAIGGVSDEIVLHTKENRSRSRRSVLVAAVAAALLLVGCAAAYLGLNEYSMGNSPFNDGVNEEMSAVSQGKTEDAITMAQKEWYAFQAAYDPEGTYATNEDQIPEIADNYEYNYGCYTQEMVDQLTAIAEKYNLKLLDTRIAFQNYQSDIFLEETGIHSLMNDSSSVQITGMAGMFYPPCNFRMMPTLDTGKGIFFTTIQYNSKDYFPTQNVFYADLSNMEQWEKTAPDGSRLILGLSNDGPGVILADLESAVISITVDGAENPTENPLTKEILETIAESFDYTIRPENVDPDAIEAKLQEAEQARK